MSKYQQDRRAYGRPGVKPRWNRSDKDAIVTALGTSSQVWATLSSGIVNEVYYPAIDRPQVRDLQFLVTDGKTFFHDERRDTESTTELLSNDSLGYRVINRDRQGRYEIEKMVIAAPHCSALLIHTHFRCSDALRGKVRLFALLAPHLDAGGNANSGFVDQDNEQCVMLARRNDSALAMGCRMDANETGFVRGSCGFVGVTDGWTDLNHNFRMDWEFREALDGNIALMGEVELTESTGFLLAIGFGENLHLAKVRLANSLAVSFGDSLLQFQKQWQRADSCRLDPLVKHAHDNGKLLLNSYRLLLAHEDKRSRGALVASLSIPWGEAKSEEDLGGYHRVWPRDMVNCAIALIAAGETATPLRVLIFLSCTQSDDGGFQKNVSINGDASCSAIPLDEVALPVLLAWHLKQADALERFSPWPMVRAAAVHLVLHKPWTQQERWGENAGYSPSTMAVQIAAMVCASEFAAERREVALADYFAEYADFLKQHIERWTVTSHGKLLAGVRRHFVRTLPMGDGNLYGAEDIETARVFIRHRDNELPSVFDASDIVDAGFLELVRYGIYSADDPLIVDSLKVVDKVLKVNTLNGPCWRRYNHDGYGQRADGGPFTQSGQGRAWPLLTGERAHRELAAGKDVGKLVQAMENFAGVTGLLPEQIWDQPDLPAANMYSGSPTGSAMPSMSAHAEYIKLLRSIEDERPFDRIEPVCQRYCRDQKQICIEIWSFVRPVTSVPSGNLLRIQAGAAFQLRFTFDDWKSHSDAASSTPGEGIHFIDFPPDQMSSGTLKFTFFWTDSKRWEGRDVSVQLAADSSAAS